MNDIRNFAIIAHIDHGKSTLADRLMEICGAVDKNHQAQLLDSLELEREHGITIKLKAIRLNYELRTQNSELVENYALNLIDTPGHVDFSYEVSRSLASVEGAILLVDAAQGVQAQTLANFNLAKQAKLTVIPVINKIDLLHAEIERTTEELVSLGFNRSEIIKVSAKTGEGVEALLEHIIRKIPAPQSLSSQTSALIFDSALDPYKGVIATVRLFGGQVNRGDQIGFVATGAKAEVLQIGYLTPKPVYVDSLDAGGIGFIVTNLKDLSKVLVGDTVVLSKDPAEALSGYRQVKPVVFFSFYPTNPSDFAKLKSSLEKLRLNDAAITFDLESSGSLGQGFRVGFLGLLHAQITQERLEREYDLDIIATSPSVNFIIDGKLINKPSNFNPIAKDIQEPYAKATIFSPQKYYGAVSSLIHDRRGEITSLTDISNLLKVEVEIPLLDLVIGFYDQLKSVSSGYASFDFELADYRPAKLVKLDILVNYMPIEGLSQVVPQEKAQNIGGKIVEKLKEAIPKQQIPVPIQAAVGGKILARETVPAFRKDVTQKLYGGDVTRKMKLLEKQKKGKKRMRRFGQVDIPQEAFLAVLKI